MQARRVYEQDYKRSIDEGLLSVDDMKELVKKRDLIGEEDRRKLSSLKGKLDGQKVLLARTTRVKANQERIKRAIEDLQTQITDIENKERSAFSLTAETKAEEARILYLCWTSCYDFFTNNLIWSEYEKFLNEKDFLFRQRLTSEFILFYSGLSTSCIRAIARSNLWRIRYITSVKTSDPLFGRASSEYTNDMLNLGYWSHYYQNIYEMMPEDQPSEDIIEDDASLDAYLKEYYNERNRDAGARRDRKQRKGSMSAFDKEEVLVTRTNELYEDIAFDEPREARSIKDKPLIKKKTRRGRRS